MPERLRIDSAGRVLIGRTASRMVGGSTTYAKLQVAGTSQSESSISIVNNENNTNGAFLFIGKTRGSSVGTSTIVQNGDTLGGLSFIGADGNDTNNRTAEITAVVNGGPGNNTIPTDLTFSTSTQNATQLTERMRIYSTGRILIGNGASEQGPSGNLDIVGDINGNGAELYLRVSNNNTTDNIGALLFGNNVDKSIVKIQGVTHTANNTGDIAFHTSNAGSMSERLRITNSGKLCMGGSTGQYTLNNTSTDIIIGSGGSGRGITFHTSAYADNMTISFHANESLSRAEGEIKYGPPLTSTSADRNVMMFRTNSSERLRINASGALGLNGANYGSSGQVLTSQGSGSSATWSTVGGKVVNYDSTIVTAAGSASVGQGNYSNNIIGLSYAAASSSNKLLLIASVSVGYQHGQSVASRFTVSNSGITAATGDASGSRRRATTAAWINSRYQVTNMTLVYEHSSPSTSAVTYGVQLGQSDNSTQTVYWNRSEYDDNYNWRIRAATTLTIIELEG